LLCVCVVRYWYYSLMTLFMLVSFEATVVKRRLKHLEYVRDMRVPPFKLSLYRDGRWQDRMSNDLLPGDLVSMTRTVGDNVCPCDVLLLSGQAVVNEALLTGESVPQVKEPIDLNEGDVPLAISKQHKRHILFGGTKVMMTSHKDTGEEAKASVKLAPDNGCLCFVLHTGFSSGQGKLVRTILYSTERVSVNNTESLLFILFLLVFAVMASGYVLYHGLQDEGRSRYKLFLNCTHTAAHCQHCASSHVSPVLLLTLSRVPVCRYNDHHVCSAARAADGAVVGGEHVADAVGSTAGLLH
jgi:cation-transporting ATPase 13A1